MPALCLHRMQSLSDQLRKAQEELRQARGEAASAQHSLQRMHEGRALLPRDNLLQQTVRAVQISSQMR